MPASELYPFMQDIITYEPLSSTTVGSSKTYGAPIAWLCRIEQGARLVRDKDGRETVSSTRLFLRALPMSGVATVPHISGRFTLPDGYAPQSPPAISVERLHDEFGIHHWTVNL
jgi:hypothetical protein